MALRVGMVASVSLILVSGSVDAQVRAISTPQPLTDQQRRIVQTFTQTYCTQMLGLLQGLINANRPGRYRDYLQSLHQSQDAQCKQAAAFRLQDSQYQAWLVEEQRRQQAARNNPTTPPPAPLNDMVARSNQLFGPLGSGPNDPLLSNQRNRGLNNINIVGAWAQNRDCNDIRIWVLDTGINDHPDLNGQILRSLGFNFVGNNSVALDDQGHGTAVMGTITANTNNGVGIAGVCWRARVVPVKVMNAQGSGTMSDILRGLAHVANSTTQQDSQRVQVMNASISIMSSVVWELGGANRSQTTLNAIRALDSKNIVSVISSGNSGQVLGTSAMSSSLPSSLLVVGATNPQNQVTSWSNYGGVTNIYAPGDNVVTTNREGGYTGISGTSFSAPITSGVVALTAQKFSNLNNRQIAAKILSSATSFNDSRAGRNLLVNADAALR